jgi:hypothetical protein
MNAYEEELQKNIEAGKPVSGDDLDARAYQHVFKALQKEPDYKLSSRFADQIIQKAALANEKSSSSDYIWFGVGIFFLVISFIVAVVISLSYIGFKPSLGFLSAISEYKGLVVLALALIVIFNRVEKRLMSERKVV